MYLYRENDLKNLPSESMVEMVYERSINTRRNRGGRFKFILILNVIKVGNFIGILRMMGGMVRFLLAARMVKVGLLGLDAAGVFRGNALRLYGRMSLQTLYSGVQIYGELLFISQESVFW